MNSYVVYLGIRKGCCQLQTRQWELWGGAVLSMSMKFKCRKICNCDMLWCTCGDKVLLFFIEYGQSVRKFECNQHFFGANFCHLATRKKIHHDAYKAFLCQCYHIPLWHVAKFDKFLLCMITKVTTSQNCKKSHDCDIIYFIYRSMIICIVSF